MVNMRDDREVTYVGGIHGYGQTLILTGAAEKLLTPAHSPSQKTALR
jgi:hypothetical protein